MSAQEMVNYLNEIKDLDPEWMKWIIDYRPVCKRELAEHPTLVAGKKEGKELYFAGFLGLINGFYLPNEVIRADLDESTGELKGFALGNVSKVVPPPAQSDFSETAQDESMSTAVCSEGGDTCVHSPEPTIDHVSIVSKQVAEWDQAEWDRLVAEEQAISAACRSESGELDALCEHSEALLAEVDAELTSLPPELLAPDDGE